jgi:hypothetical protein
MKNNVIRLLLGIAIAAGGTTCLRAYETIQSAHKTTWGGVWNVAWDNDASDDIENSGATDQEKADAQDVLTDIADYAGVESNYTTGPNFDSFSEGGASGLVETSGTGPFDLSFHITW